MTTFEKWQNKEISDIDCIRELQKEKIELIGALAIALDNKRRTLYIPNLKQTLNKYN